MFLLATEGHGMTTESLAREINIRELHLRKDGQPVTSKQVYAVCMRCKEMFAKEGTLIRLLA